MIGRILCRLGLHKYGFGTAIDPTSEGYTACDYSWCKRRECSEPVRLVNVETRRIPEYY